MLTEWARKEGMQINAEKTKLMVFGRHTHNVVVKVNGVSLENVDSFKYLGVMLDKELNFAAQVDYAVSKGKRACAKVGYLIDGLKGVNIDMGICNKVHLNYVKCIIVYTHITLELYRLD